MKDAWSPGALPTGKRRQCEFYGIPGLREDCKLREPAQQQRAGEAGSAYIGGLVGSQYSG